MQPRRRTLPAWKKALFGGLTATTLLLGFELGAAIIWGEPPPYDMVSRLSRCQLLPEADGVALRCQPSLREEPTWGPPDERKRVVFLGGSSVRRPQHGNMADALQGSDPRLEVLNLAVDGMGAANIALLSSQLHLLQPDLVVIYTGHNDYSGSVYRGEIRATRLWLMPVYGLLARSWIHGLLRRTPVALPGSEDGARGEHQSRRARTALLTRDDTALRLRPELDARFRGDLALALARSPAPVIVTTLLRNPAWSPSGQLLSEAPDCTELSEAAISRQALGSGELEDLEAACGPTGWSWWARSRLAHSEGRLDEAAEAFARSTELDPLPLRAPHSADEIIREVARAEGAVLVDLARTLGPLPDPDWFTDTLHLNRAGAQRVARELEPAVHEALGL